MKHFLIFFVFVFFITEKSFAETIDYSTRAVGDEGLSVVDQTQASEGSNSNQLAASICQLILILNGRTGRAIAVIAILVLAFMFMTSKLSVPVFLTFIIGMALLFGAKSIALIMLPSYIKVKEADRGIVKISPERAIKEVCPELK